MNSIMPRRDGEPAQKRCKQCTEIKRVEEFTVYPTGKSRCPQCRDCKNMNNSYAHAKRIGNINVIKEIEDIYRLLIVSGGSVSGYNINGISKRHDGSKTYELIAKIKNKVMAKIGGVPIQELQDTTDYEEV